MNVRLLLVLLVLLLTSCKIEGGKDSSTPKRFVDQEAGVVCYVSLWQSIDCIPLEDTLLH